MILIQRKLKLGVRSASKHIFILSHFSYVSLSLSLIFSSLFLLTLEYSTKDWIQLNGRRIDTTLKAVISKIQQVTKNRQLFSLYNRWYTRALFFKKFFVIIKFISMRKKKCKIPWNFPKYFTKKNISLSFLISLYCSTSPSTHFIITFYHGL